MRLEKIRDDLSEDVANLTEDLEGALNGTQRPQKIEKNRPKPGKGRTLPESAGLPKLPGGKEGDPVVTNVRGDPSEKRSARTRGRVK